MTEKAEQDSFREKRDKPILRKERSLGVICLSCNNKVEVKLIPYGSKYVGICPDCKKLAYSGD